MSTIQPSIHGGAPHVTSQRPAHPALHWLCLLCLVVSLRPAAAAPLLLVADEWCPYNCGEHDPRQGYVIDLLQTIFAEAGMQSAYRVVPWSRAIKMVEQSKADLLIGTNAEITPHLLLSLPIGEQRTCFFAARGSTWQFHSIADLHEQRLGVIQDYSSYDGGGALDSYIASSPPAQGKVLRATGTQALQNNFLMLAAGRLDVLVENCNVGAYRLQSLGLTEQIQTAGQLDGYHASIHIGLNPNAPDAQKWLALISQGLSEKRRSGELERLLRTYGLHDWVPAP